MTVLVWTGAPAQDVVPLRDLLPLIERQERSVEALEIEAFSAMTKGSRENPERAGECRLRVRLEVGQAWPRFSASLDPEVLYWVDRDCFVASITEIGFNGRWSWNWQRSMTVEGEEAIPVDSAVVLPERSRRWDDVSGGSGWYATVPGFFSTKGISFSEAIANEGDSVWSCVKGAEGEIVARRVREKTTETWTLVPTWGFAIGSYACVQDGLRRHELTVTKSTRVVDDLWYPVELEWTARFGAGPLAVTNRRAVSVSSVRTCDAATLSAGPLFTRGTAVRDEIAGVSFRVAGDDMALAEVVAEQGAEVRAVWAALEEERDWESWPWVIGGVVALGCLAWLVRRHRGCGKRAEHRQRRRLGTAAGLIVVAAFCHSLPGQEAHVSPWVSDTTHGQRIDNCALNATLVALAAFDRSVETASVAGALGPMALTSDLAFRVPSRPGLE